MKDTAGEAGTNTVMYSYGPPHVAEKKQDDQFEHTFSSYVRIRDVALKTCLRRWTIGRSGERGSGISVLTARHDDDDECYIVKLITISLCANKWLIENRTIRIVFNWNHFEMRLLNLIPNKDNYKIGTDPTMEDQIRRTNNWLYKTKKSIHTRPFGARDAADRGVESLRFQVSVVRR